MTNAEERAIRHARAFVEKHRTYKKIYAKYAEVSDEQTRIIARILRKQEAGKKVSEEEYEDFEYYGEFCNYLATVIADHALEESGYSKDEEGYWS